MRSPGQQTPHSELTVFAAASLTEACQTLGREFEAIHPSVTVQFNFGGSQQLVQQIVHGAEADVFASANMKQMRNAIDAGVIDTAFIGIFAQNKLVIIMPSDNPAHIESIGDLAKQHITLVLADPSVPAGLYALQFLDRASQSSNLGSSFRQNVLRNVVSYEENVRVVLSKVKLGECDAGIVYTSDIANDTLHEVRRIDIPDEMNVIAEYPAAIVRGTRSRTIAHEFIEFLISADGEQTLSKFGFLRGKETGK